MRNKRLALLALVAAAFTLLVVQAGTAAQPLKHKPKHHVKKKPKPGLNAVQKLAHVKHIVVIYEENHSFDDLYGGWEGVNGRSNADAPHTTQVNQAGTPYTCLKQIDANLDALPHTCTDSTTGTTFTS